VRDLARRAAAEKPGAGAFRPVAQLHSSVIPAQAGSIDAPTPAIGGNIDGPQLSLARYRGVKAGFYPFPDVSKALATKPILQITVII